jgi:diamine N-acetyltransferase
MTGKNIALRAVELSDADLIYQWENDPAIWQVSNTITPFSRYVIEQYILNSEQDIFTAKQLRLMIDRISGDAIHTIGTVDLFDFDPLHRRAGVGIMILKQERGHGFASEALELLKAYVFETLQLHQLFCHITPDNTASLALFRKHGFVICGTRKDWLRLNDGWKEEHILQCINPAESNNLRH